MDDGKLLTLHTGYIRQTNKTATLPANSPVVRPGQGTEAQRNHRSWAQRRARDATDVTRTRARLRICSVGCSEEAARNWVNNVSAALELPPLTTSSIAHPSDWPRRATE